MERIRELEFWGVVTTEDLSRAMRVSMWPRGSSSIYVGILAAAALFVFVVEPLWSGRGWLELLKRVAPAALFVVLLALWVPRMLRRTLESSKLLRSGFRGTISEAGLTWASEHADVRLAWTDFVGVRQSDDVVLLYTGLQQFLGLHRRYFGSDADWLAFKQLALERVSDRGRQVSLPATARRLVLLMLVVVVLVLIWNALQP